VIELTDYANRRGLLLTTPELADETLNLYFEDLFFAGEPQYLARNALYGLCKVRGWSASRPRFHKAKDALTGWAAKLPATPREPPPFEAVQLTCAVLDNGTTSDLLACLASVTGFDMYFRPGELLAIKPEHVFGSRTSGRASDITVVVAPLGDDKPAKNKDFDCTVKAGTDLPVRRVVPEILSRLRARARRQKLPTLFHPLSLPLFEKTLKQAAHSAGVGDLLSVPHQLRHGGPSHDALNKIRPIEAIQQRGRWRARESVRIYEKHGSALRQRSKLTELQISSAARFTDSTVRDILRRVCAN
jgi:hypothetical protein